MKSTIFLSSNPADLCRRPYGEDGLTLAICLHGSLRVRMDNTEYEIRSNDLLRYLGATTIEDVRPSADCQIRIYTAQLHTMDKAFYHCLRTEGDWWGKWNFVMGHPVIHMNERQRRIGRHFHELISLYMDDESYDYREQALDLIKQIFIYEVLMWIKQTAPAEAADTNNERMLSRDAIMMQFMHLVESHSASQREVRWYADQLHITPKYLSEVVKAVTGKTAILVIREQTLREIENQLLHSDKSIKEIAYDMNFTSISSFSKYVHQYLGACPAILRAQETK